MKLEKECVLLGATIIDGTGSDPQEDMAITISEGKIAKIEKAQNSSVSRGTQQVDLSGYFLLPGLIDTHVHLTGWRDADVRNWVLEHQLLRAFRCVNDAKKILTQGFTTVRDISWNGLYLKKAIEEGEVLGPRIVPCGPGISRRGGHGDVYQLPIEVVERDQAWAVLADGVDEIRRTVRMLIRNDVDVIKIWTTGGGLWEKERSTDMHYSPEEIVTAITEAKMISNIKVAAHCETSESARICVEAGADTIEHGQCLGEEVADLMVERGVVLVPTLYLMKQWFTCTDSEGKAVFEPCFHPRPEHAPYLEQGLNRCQAILAMIQDNLTMARSKGVKIALGSDCFAEGITPFGNCSIMELITLVDYGLTPMEAIVSATKIGAEALGLEDTIGTLEKSKVADLLLVAKDPLSDISVMKDQHNIKWVVKNGQVVVENAPL